MAYITLIVCLIIFFLGYYINKSIISPEGIYSFSWAICIVSYLVLSGFYGGFKCNDRVFAMIILSQICFCFGSQINLVNRNKTKGLLNKKVTIECNNDTQIHFKLLVSLNVFAYCIIIPKFIDSFQTLISSSSVFMIRYNLVNGDGSEQFIINDLIKQVFVLPIFTATIYIAFDSIINCNDKQKRKLLFLALFDILVYTVTYLGRMMIQGTIIFIIIVYISSSKWSTVSIKTKRRVKRLFLFLIIMSIIALIVITVNRSLSSEDSIAYTVFAYFGGSLKYFDTGIDAVDNNGSVLFGTGLFAGLWDVPLLIIQRIIRVDFLRPLEIITSYNSPLRLIGTRNLYMTAFGTVLLNMYIDGRWLGIIIESFLLGLIASTVKNYYLCHRCQRYRVYYYTSLMFLVWTMLFWDGNRVSSILIFVYVHFFTEYKCSKRIKQ